MSTVNIKYLKDESGNKFSPVTSVDSVYRGTTKIADEYIRGLSVSGKTITYTKGNGGTGTITTQDTTYTHPSYTARTSNMYKITVNNTGHVSAATAITKSDITGLGIPAQDTTYSVATASANGLMSSTLFTKLNNIKIEKICDSGEYNTSGGTITLTKAASNYDLLLVCTGYTTDNSYATNIWLPYNQNWNTDQCTRITVNTGSALSYVSLKINNSTFTQIKIIAKGSGTCSTVRHFYGVKLFT